MIDPIPNKVYEDATTVFLNRWSVDGSIPEAIADVIEAAYRAGRADAESELQPRLWRAANLFGGKCRYCRRGTEPSAEHRMDCQHYVGPLEHHWTRIGWNQTFGGVDHFCSCGGYFRQGGSTGHGDGSREAEPMCPKASQDWRGPTP